MHQEVSVFKISACIEREKKLLPRYKNWKMHHKSFRSRSVGTDRLIFMYLSTITYLIHLLSLNNLSILPKTRCHKWANLYLVQRREQFSRIIFLLLESGQQGFGGNVTEGKWILHILFTDDAIISLHKDLSLHRLCLLTWKEKWQPNATAVCYFR